MTAVRDVVNGNLEAGHILPFDAAQTIWESAMSDIGRR
jgi:hypothetical protein